MTTYGTIPTAPQGSDGSFISQSRERARSALATRRPWREMLDRHAVGIPSDLGEAFARIGTNLSYFRTNYAIIVLLILFLSLLWHPISLIVFVIMMAAWLFLYFLRDEPLMIFHRTVNDRIVLFVLAVLTFVFLLLTHVTTNILVSLLIGVVVVLLHAVFRKEGDLYLGEEARSGGMYSVVSDDSKRPLNEPSSSIR